MQKFTIRKNRHSSKLFGFLPHFGFTFKNIIKFSAKFDDNCLYDLHDVDNWDANKLYGVSTSYNHMIQSGRIGWRCLDGENIEVLAFVHDNHKFLEAQVLGTVKPNEWFNCSIVVKDYSFFFSFTKNNNTNVILIPKKTKGWKFKYKLFPFFGGNESAPHDMTIWIKK
ncbi:MAG: hypothetical protein RLZZ546_736 [Bacteroidota bacterium]|jgi:hypothetical protein